jgi:hypothetical protein
MPIWEVVIIALGLVEAVFLAGLYLIERRWRTH